MIGGIDLHAGLPVETTGADAPPLSGIIDDRYRVLERIGAGAMGSVYRAEHLALGRLLAIKVLRRELCREPEMIRRFQHESRMAARIQSEHVVDILDAGTLPDGVPYFVMELLAGRDLRSALVRDSPFAPLRAAHLGVDVCRGLEMAHALGLVHRDLKPENLFLTRGDDGREVVKILDFGVAKSNETATTRPGALIGTVRYMAPEQVGLDLPLGPATDVYALGVILYECLSGTVPFLADTLERTLYCVMTGTPKPLASLRPELPTLLCEVIDRALARHPRDRHASAAALRIALAPFTGDRSASRALPLLDQASVPASLEPTCRVALEVLPVGVAATLTSEPLVFEPQGLSAPARPRRRRTRSLWVGVAIASACCASALLLLLNFGADRAPALNPSARAGRTSEGVAALRDGVAASPTPAPPDATATSESPLSRASEDPARALSPAPRPDSARPSSNRPARPAKAPAGTRAAPFDPQNPYVH